MAVSPRPQWAAQAWRVPVPTPPTAANVVTSAAWPPTHMASRSGSSVRPATSTTTGCWPKRYRQLSGASAWLPRLRLQRRCGGPLGRRLRQWPTRRLLANSGVQGEITRRDPGTKRGDRRQQRRRRGRRSRRDQHRSRRHRDRLSTPLGRRWVGRTSARLAQRFWAGSPLHRPDQRPPSRLAGIGLHASDRGETRRPRPPVERLLTGVLTSIPGAEIELRSGALARVSGVGR